MGKDVALDCNVKIIVASAINEVSVNVIFI
jgi:hypothetical protein